VNNWHRKIWKLNEIPPGSGTVSGLFRAGSSNEFWFEPYVAKDANTLCFRVKFLGTDMADLWKGVKLMPRGDQAFVSSANPSPATTERLEGPIEIQDVVFTLKVYIDHNVTPEQLVLDIRGGSDGGGTGIATGEGKH
jgi:hypothetical protein